MENYSFTQIDIVVHWYTRMRSWFISKRDNRILYRQFSTELHLDKLEKENISFVLPESYLIITNEIKQLYNVRDEILIKMHHKEYAAKQIAIDDKIEKLKTEHDTLKLHRIDEKKYYDRVFAKLKTIKHSGDYIALETQVSQARSKYKNTDSAIKHCENQITSLIRTKKANFDNWSKQIELVEKAIDDIIVKYINRATKKIGLHYGFTTFKYNVEDYNNKLKKIINGDY